MKLKLYIVIFILLPFLRIYAQNIKHISESEGLPQSFISGLAQDKEGFIWIATRNGLARYDGHDFKIFQQPLLASNAITHLYKSKNDKLWLKYETGEIDCIDAVSGRVGHIITNGTLKKHKLRIIRRGWLPDTENKIWYIADKNRIERFNYSGNGTINPLKGYTFNGDTVRSQLNDSKGRIWILSQKGLNLFDSVKGAFTAYKLPYRQYFNEQMDYGADTPNIHEMANGQLMWSDLKNIFFFDPKTFRYSKVPLPEPVMYGLGWISTGPDTYDYFVAGKNLYCYNGTTVKRITVANLPELENVQAFLVDSSGLVWTGGNGNGITQIDPDTNFTSADYDKNFAVDILSNYLHFPAGKVALNDAPKRGVLPLSYYLRSVNKGNAIYIALGRSVYKYENGVTSLPPLPGGADRFSPVKGISLGYDGSIYTLDKGGNLYVFNDAADKWFAIPLKKDAGFNTLVKGDPNYMYVGKEYIWITTEYEGLFYIDIKTGSVKKCPLLYGNCYYTIVPDAVKDNIIWIGSPQGLIRLSTKSLESASYAVSKGLPDNVVYSLLPDAQGNLWFGTNKGLVRFNTNTCKSRVFTIQHGLPNNEFNRYHQLALPDDRLAFGGIKGYTVFNPKDLADDDFNPRTALTDIRVNNAWLSNTDQTPIGLLQKLSLPYNENTLNIKYSALQFSQPSDIKYRYRLLGYDKNWVESGNNREAIFTKIPPGNYVFEVNATNNTGRWSNKVTSLPVKISPPWWNTRLALCLYVIAAVLALWWFMNFRIRQRIIKNEMQLREKEALHLRELDEMKTRFFANITHELRTPLTLILGPAEQLKQHTQNNTALLAGTIADNAGNLLNLTNQLLDIAKLEAGALKPHPQAGDIVLTIKKIADTFAMQAALRDIRIELNLPEQAGFMFDENMFNRILTNLLSNAVRHSPNNGTVTINLFCDDNGINLSVCDQGNGIPEADAQRIFKRFYSGTAENVNPGSGSGIGLSLVKELVDLQQGSVVVTPKPDSSMGACFTVSLPLMRYDNALHDTAIKPEVAYDYDFITDEKPVILIAEDNPQLALFIEGILSPHYNVIIADDGDEALPLVQKIIPDLVISDVLMQRMGGYDLCNAIKSDTNTAHIPVMLLTAKADTESKLSGLSIGADDYITKPFSVNELLMRVHNRLQQQFRLREAVRKEFTSVPQNFAVAKPLGEDPFLKQVYAVIDTHLDNDSFGVEELADALSISRASLHRKSKMLTDMTSSELLRSYRLRKAAELLVQNLTIAEAAYKTGFASPSYFTRSFKELYGITPTEYLKNAGMKQ